jgi:hypothetical protein
MRGPSRGNMTILADEHALDTTVVVARIAANGDRL